jgi:hypothetical protein
MAAGTAAEAARKVSDPVQRRALLREARKLIRRSTANAALTGIVVPANVLLACLDGQRERAVAALRESLPRAAGALIEQVHRRRLGELLGGDEGAALIAEADAFMRAGGVIDPERYAAAFTPGVFLATER